VVTIRVFRASMALHEQIADLELQIEELSDAAERCRRMMLITKAAAVLGVLLLTLTLTGLFPFNPLVFVLTIGAILGGVALFGSTRSTRDQIIASIRVREAQRKEMIDKLELQAANANG
jgi:hypothetical protein